MTGATTSRRNLWHRVGGTELRHLVSTTAGRWLAGSVAAIALLTLIGLVLLWPHEAPAPGRAATSSFTVPAKVERVIDRPCAPGLPQQCRSVVIAVDGRRVTMSLGVTGVVPSVEQGDEIRVIRPGRPDVRPPAGQAVHYDFAGFDRRTPLLWLALLVAAAATALLRWRGILAVLGIGLSLAVLLRFLVPAILAGRPPLLVAFVAALVVMFVTLILTNGIGVQTIAAALGISTTLVLTCLLGALTVRFTHLDGVVEGSVLSLRSQTGAVSVLGITLAAMLIGALGVLADTAVTQASAVMALRRADTSLSARQLYHSAFAIGRDHLSATIHTLVLAYAGTTLTVLLLLRSGHVTPLDALNTPELAVPVVATLVGCLALLVAVPLTTGLASLFAARLPAEVVAGAHHHHH